MSSKIKSNKIKSNLYLNTVHKTVRKLKTKQCSTKERQHYASMIPPKYRTVFLHFHVSISYLLATSNRLLHSEFLQAVKSTESLQAKHKKHKCGICGALDH